MNKVILCLLIINPIDGISILAKKNLKNTLKQLKINEYNGQKVRYKLEKDNKSVIHDKLKTAKTVAKDINCIKPKRVFRYSELFEKKHSEFGLDLWYECTYHSSVESKVALQSLYENDAIIDKISKVELDYEIKLYNDYPNDPLYHQQSHFESIELLNAWNFTTGSDNVIIQVIDTGIEIDHPDIQNNIWTNSEEICGNGIDDDNNGFIDDCHGYNHADNTGDNLLGGHWHGTHCGGIISASINNNIGISSICGGNNMTTGNQLMVSVVFGSSNIGGFAEALIYGADNGARISSNSWGYTSPNFVEDSILDAIDYYNNAGGIVVFAAGNDNSDELYYPGAYAGVINVAAVNNNGVRASFTNYGSTIDISAPGVDIYSTMLNKNYGTASGTSMAAPIISGIIGLGISYDSEVTNDKLINCLYDTTTNIDNINSNYQHKLGKGLVNAYRFLECISQESPTTSPTLSTIPSIAPTPLAVPTSNPTYFSPTPNEIHFRIEIIPDNYDHETSWTLKNTDESIDEECILDEESNSGGVGTYNFRLCADANYEWSIYDAWGDGMCCDFGMGSFKLFLNDVQIFEGGEFGAVLKYQFSTYESNPTLKPSSSVSSMNPTLKPSSSVPSMNPTLKPSSSVSSMNPTPKPSSSVPSMNPTLKPSSSVPSMNPTPKPSSSVMTTIEPTYQNLDNWKDINIDLLSPESLGTAILVNFRYDSIVESTGFSIEYNINDNEFKYPNSNPITTLFPFWDNVYYYVLRTNDIVCDSTIQVRIGIVLPSNEVNNKILSEQIKVECFNPTSLPTTNPPTIYPTNSPSSVPSRLPTIVPTIYPTNSPSSVPSRLPTIVPTIYPTNSPSSIPSRLPTTVPTSYPTNSPSSVPSRLPTTVPTSYPTNSPSSVPSRLPTIVPTSYPTNSPSSVPSRLPTIVPTIYPTNSPSSVPSRLPTNVPTDSPTEYGNVPLCKLTNDMNILSGNFVFEKGNNSECNLKSNNNIISSAYATNYYIQNGEISANVYSENSIKRDYGLILRIQDLDSDFQWMPRTGYHCQISTGNNNKNNSKLIISVIENGDDDHSSSIQIIKKSSEFILNPNINYHIKASAIDNVIQCGISLNDNVISQIEVTDNMYSEGYYSTWNYKDDYGSHLWNSLVIKNVD